MEASLHPAYYASSRPDLAPYVPAGLRCFLDIGCGEGAFSAAVKAATGAEAWGVEVVPQAAALARGRLDQLLEGDFESLALSLPPARFGAAFFNDALEHFRDPAAALAALKPALAPGARVVASVPNVLHFSVLAELLLRRDFRYRDCGILDATHLRFFTRRSLERLFAQSGYRVLELRSLHSSRNFFHLALAALSLGFLRQSLVTQWVLVAEVRP